MPLTDEAVHAAASTLTAALITARADYYCPENSGDPIDAVANLYDQCRQLVRDAEEADTATKNEAQRRSQQEWLDSMS